jgi:hypothetical protein
MPVVHAPPIASLHDFHAVPSQDDRARQGLPRRAPAAGVGFGNNRVALRISQAAKSPRNGDPELEARKLLKRFRQGEIHQVHQEPWPSPGDYPELIARSHGFDDGYIFEASLING